MKQMENVGRKKGKENGRADRGKQEREKGNNT